MNFNENVRIFLKCLCGGLTYRDTNTFCSADLPLKLELNLGK
jgi:hypothetical protein